MTGAPIEIVPSMLDCDQSRLAEALVDIEAAGADRVQWDVMDGSFVSRITHGPDPVKAARAASRLPFEAHLMIDSPETQWERFAEAGCAVVIVHAEATRHLHLLLQDMRAAGIRAGVALNPATPLEAIDNALDLVDHLLVMTVNPGRGGQQFIASMLPKIRDARRLRHDRGLAFDIEVDGGISAATAPVVAEAGANLLVAGSAVNAHPDGRARAIEELHFEATRGRRRMVNLDGLTAPVADADGGLERGVGLFNGRQYWEAHEAWEGAWMPHRRDPEGNFYKGLVQAAAGFYHYQRRNRQGALAKWRGGADLLGPFLPSHQGLDLAGLVGQLRAAGKSLDADGDWPDLPPPALGPA